MFLAAEGGGMGTVILLYVEFLAQCGSSSSVHRKKNRREYRIC